MREGRIEARFAEVRRQGRAALVTFITGGDPSPDLSFEILRRLPRDGADVIEIGMPFSDPMADGPTIEAAGHRALAAGITTTAILDMVRRFRAQDSATPIVLMGYYNPIYSYGVKRFLADAVAAGVDGLIVVDLPPEEDAELCEPALKAGLRFIRLATPTTDAARLPQVLKNASGFLYYVAVAGITGTRSADARAVAENIARIRRHTDLPIAVGFGVKEPAQAAALAQFADGVVVGSAIVSIIAQNLDGAGGLKPGALDKISAFVTQLADATHRAPAPVASSARSY